MRKQFLAVAAALLLPATGAFADYETRPELRPEHRCGGVPYTDGDGNTYTAPAIPPSFVVTASGHENEGQTVFRRAADQYENDRGEALPAVTDADIGDAVDPGGVGSLHCQKLFWDIPAPLELGLEALGTPFDEDRVPRFPNGLVDRLPPLYLERDPVTGVAVAGFESPCPGGGVDCAPSERRESVCPDHMVPWWQPILEGDSKEPVERSFSELTNAFLPAEYDDGSGVLHAPGGQDEQYGPAYRLSCRRGSRGRLGPWQIGTDPNVYDRLPEGSVRFEATDRLDADAAEGRIYVGTGPEDSTICEADDPRPLCEGKEAGSEVMAHGRREWNTGTAFYNHFASHHGTCWNPETALTSGVAESPYTCNDPDDPWTASDVRNYHPGGEFSDLDGNPYDKGTCYDYQHVADGPSDPDGEGSCYSADEEVRCDNDLNEGQMFRNATQYPGRLYVEIPDGRGVISLEDQIWDCEHHVVTQLPAGSYGMQRTANYRLQKGGIRNPRTDEPLHGAPAGEYIGGTVGEKIIQYFTEPLTNPDIDPVNVSFEVVLDLATTWYPPFTWNLHTFAWHAPFDLAVGLITTHSHHRSVKVMVDALPANPIRSASADAACGGSANEQPLNLYTSTTWEDAKVCEYWKQADGPVVLRKGQALRTTCYVNNGVTPEAIKHGLVAGSAVEAMRVSGAPIPEQPSTVPTSTWADLLVQSPIGQEFLYGAHPPENYRVKYSCGPVQGLSFDAPLNSGTTVCNPNPAVDADGDYVDGPYKNVDQCGEDQWCNPSTIVFANVGEDEMCIPIFMFWRLDNLVNEDGSINEEALANLQAGNIDEVGLPGAIQKSPGDVGDCRECPTGAGW